MGARGIISEDKIMRKHKVTFLPDQKDAEVEEGIYNANLCYSKEFWWPSLGMGQMSMRRLPASVVSQRKIYNDLATIDCKEIIEL
jgi:hypothetical protein